ncbi:SDR family oxidoreductase [Mesorhizobium sp. B3-1-3]|uniref:SDR family NAD(P)-dependent oxidoreductase n=1 Tax=unclassified Mesorhizobium TaxID=325217 RepID=UPI00112C6671|nr:MULTISPECIES: SDR family oxidoreductase [unclassified Mesorhizobium]TPI61460.1 SDR family oxidoreductase [Mesorhizobium sp. B3-1-8]TPI70589.1 SDR family oxidoreductase [Mesorhizobium sp. B3-1-3]
MLSYDLSGKRALVTGGASGIGLATVKRLAESGCKVALNHLPDDPRGFTEVQILRDQGFDVINAPFTIGGGNEDELVTSVVDQLDGIDLLVNNAATPGARHPISATDLELITDELWSAVLQTNLVGLFRLTRAAAPILKDAGGAVVSLASVSALTSRGSSMAYAASKAGIITLTRHLAQGLAPKVRVNAVAPGAVDSTWQIEWTEEQRRSSIQATPLRRRCAPEDIAETIVYLGFGAPMINGQTIVVDGGLTL